MTAELQKQVEHWRSLAEKYKKSYEASQEELEEFQASSRELEAEMETQLEQQERKLKDLTALNQKQDIELDSLRERYNQLQISSREEIDKLESEIDVLRLERDESQKGVRELEQLNDDLERAKRVLVTSLEDFEKRMNETLERNVFLESELDDRDSLLVSLQRFKDETRDLRQELQTREHKERRGRLPSEVNGTLPAGAGSADPARVRRSSSRSSREDPTVKVDGAYVPMQTSPGASAGGAAAGNRAITPSARISALNIVGDLLRKVGALESKLASCRKLSDVQQQQQHQQQIPGTPGNIKNISISKIPMSTGKPKK